jgi:DNA-binding NarL/FixJ family response regulator
VPSSPRRGRIESSGRGGDGTPVGIILAERDARLRHRLGEVLIADAGISMLASTGAAATAAQLAPQRPVRVMVFGSSLGQREVLAAIDILSRQAPDIRSLVLTCGQDEQEQHRVLIAGASGVLPCVTPPARLPRAIRALDAGEAVVPPRLLTFLLRRFHRATDSWRPTQRIPEPLSSREWEVIDELAAGRTTAATAKRLGIALATVHSHLRNIYGKLGVANRTEALAVAERLRSQKHRSVFGSGVRASAVDPWRAAD